MEKHPHSRLTVSEYRHFGLSFGLGMLILTLIGWWKGFPPTVMWVTAGLWLYHWIGGILWPKGLWITQWIASRLWDVLSHLISTIVLGTLFYLILTPLFILLRLFGQDHVHKNTGEWQDFSPKENDLKRMQRWF
ncbi:hypothetical protein [Thermospira aquatica]|uniref:SxtJ n=1 Tax=Thermospira aquatica TaxID=2828656 RepID=A0AAX3BCN8_9SPIR|nr:hypothetical protein [Thermospira aquatica]URA10028.1 hypothetical protein KDW03_11180 [Thermospira aquatica]